jgi:uracil-DNA glycosylase
MNDNALPFNFKAVHASWHECLNKSLAKMDANYLVQLSQCHRWLPGHEKIFNAFSLTIDQVNYVLFGESPYPRAQSANGYAFWDADVAELWSSSGLSKKVNRATSLRNILKMLLIAEGSLDKNHTTQPDIANLDKSHFVQTNHEFFTQLLNKGFLLLNATLVLQDGPPQKDARAWQPFIKELLACLLQRRPKVTFILMGRIANEIDKLLPHQPMQKLYVEHPYNLSFVTNPDVIQFFEPLGLLRK